MKTDPSIRKPALLQKVQRYGYVSGQDSFAAATYNRHDEQMVLVDEPGPDRLCGERRTTYRNVVMRLSLQVANRLRVEYSLETGL